MNELEKLIQNDDFLHRLATIQNPDDLGALFHANNIVLEDDLTVEDAFKLIKRQENAEFSADDLDSVTGGSLTLGTAVLCGGALGVGVGAICFLGGCAYAEYKHWKRKH